MRTTITLDEDAHRAVKSIAEATGKSLGAVISELVRQALRATPEPAQPEGDDLPVFRIRREAEIIPSSRAGELLAEEGAD